MPHEAYCVAFRKRRWSVLYKGRDLGAFHLRTNALKFAIAPACRPNLPSHKNVYVLDRDGVLYTAWSCARDHLTLHD